MSLTPEQAKQQAEWLLNQIKEVLTNTPHNPIASNKPVEYYENHIAAYKAIKDTLVAAELWPS